MDLFSPEEMSRRTYWSPSSDVLPHTDWRPPRRSDVHPFRDAKRICLDVETRDEQINKLGPGCRRKDCYVVGIALAIEDGGQWYFPLRHEGGDNCDWDVIGWLREEIVAYHGVIVTNGGDYDLDWIANDIPEILTKDVMEIQVLDVLIDENQFEYGLDTLCTRYGLPGKDETLLRQAAGVYRVDPKNGLWRMPGRFAGVYGEVDARRPLQILRRQEKLIEPEGIRAIWELEQQVTPICVEMRRRGIRVDMDKVDAIDRRAIEVATDELRRVHHMTGIKLGLGDLWKSDSLARVVRSQGYEIMQKTNKGADSVDNDFLVDECGELGVAIARARRWDKLRTTYCKQVRDHAIWHGDEWRVHCTFNQMKQTKEHGDGEKKGKGVRYGRFSSSDFNIQGQPVRDDEFGNLWRSVYVADRESAGWACNDWSQQEPRIGVHYAELLGLPGAKEFADAYRADPSLDIHQRLTDLANDPRLPRKIVKNTVNGRLYGEGDVKLCRDLKKPVVFKMVRDWKTGQMEKKLVPGEEGQYIIDRFKEFAPWLGMLVKEASKVAEKRGYVWAGPRKCRFVKGGDGKFWATHKAFSRIGQGEAANQMKATLVASRREGLPIQAVVHDEFDFSYQSLRQVRLLKELQLNTVKFNVPMKVDSEVGPSWGELEKIPEVA